MSDELGYYRPKDTNPNWLKMWPEMLSEDCDWQDVLDELCRMACGIEVGASDECQRYAKHIHGHLQAALLVGLEVGINHDVSLEEVVSKMTQKEKKR